MKVLCAAAITALLIAAQPALAKGGGGRVGSHAATSSHKSSSRPSSGDHPVKGYSRKDGEHVEPTRATNPNSTKRDNYSSKGNVNPANGKKGTKEADR